MSRSNKTIGITLGDPTGIGPEVTAKALKQLRLGSKTHIKLIGHASVVRPYLARLPQNCSVIDVGPALSKKIIPGQTSRETAQASVNYLNKAVDLIRSGAIQALVTAPVCKEAISDLGYSFPGHTEFLAEAFKIKKFGMMFVTEQLRTMIVTRHIPIGKVSAAIQKEMVYENISLARTALQKHFHIRHPHIAVCGLNPHAGEGGTIGKEEAAQIIPAIQKAQKAGLKVSGPFAADTLFVMNKTKKFDVIIAMYHDQGLIPIKTLYFDQLVNLTVGLPFVRTSPAHGTAFDIAGKNKANPSSMREAIALAAKLSE
ncbi:MAG: 4-hydroxythreonine-4-phosphate dehydrogenase PdxA [Omnitrophica WOR_2 bacterium RIFCSPHIGHO2_02_FULL_48_11]|nr:MAG: 4-hydroxythreonine-4-phosphate dehydrogenase PdxA [Omnitrophica WOR_2 bacterium RIFCSPHIGHO2_02_FULL_48_11]